MKWLTVTFLLLLLAFGTEAGPRGVQPCKSLVQVWKSCKTGCERQCHGELICGATLPGCKDKKTEATCVCQKGFSRSADGTTCKPDAECPLP
uniref:TIL domain-containing protein n=1 Tax=Steinernema glaseri TaxID=37863 RepID=A0A1I8A6G8_9BILA